MKLLIFVGICFAFFIQISVQLPAKLNDQKVLPLPSRNDKSLKTFGKIDAKKPQQILESKGDEAVKRSIAATDEAVKDKFEHELNENNDINAELITERDKRFILNVVKIVAKVLPKTWPQKKTERSTRDIVVVDDGYIYDDRYVLTQNELVDLILLEAAADTEFDQYHNDNIFKREEMTEFAKREKRWDFLGMFKKRVKDGAPVNAAGLITG